MADFRILTFMTDAGVYSEMRRTFEAGGFVSPDAVFEVIDNSAGNIADPYTVVNKTLSTMLEPYLIFCHQDVRLEDSTTIRTLQKQIAIADREFPRWAVAGPAGLDMRYQQVLCVSDPWEVPKWPGPWPVEAEVLDELLLVIRPGRTELTRGLVGFHFYAADLCLSARRQGGTALVIDFPVIHLSNGEGGRLSGAYREARNAFQEKLSQHYGFRVLQTTTLESMVLSRYRWLRKYADRRRVRVAAIRLFRHRVAP